MTETSLGERMKAFRLKQNVTIKSMARAIPISGRTLWRVETGQELKDLAVIKRIEKFLMSPSTEQVAKLKRPRKPIAQKRGRARYMLECTPEEIDEDLSDLQKR